MTTIPRCDTRQVAATIMSVATVAMLVSAML